MHGSSMIFTNLLLNFTQGKSVNAFQELSKMSKAKNSLVIVFSEYTYIYLLLCLLVCYVPLRKSKKPVPRYS